MERNSKIIIAKNIKLDRNYNNVLDYTEDQMLQLLNENKVAESSSYSYIRTNSSIKTQFPYSQCMKANYIAFQNPDYENKWFFGWIDDVIYKSDGCGEISFTIDVWSTWFRNVNLLECFVEREHVNDDTIGLHTIPEPVSTGDYVVQGHYVDDYNRNTEDEPYCIVVASTISFENDDKVFMAKYTGIPTGVRYGFWHIRDMQSVQNVVKRIESTHPGAILSMFIAPYWLAEVIDKYDPSSETNPDYEVNNPAFRDISVIKISNLDGYIPKNNKLLTFPYCCFTLTNAQGSAAILKQELWEEAPAGDEFAGECVIRIIGCLTQGCSIRAIPKQYNGDEYAVESGINLGKFPQLGWNTDAFTNWLTQNGVNIASDIAFAGISIATGNALAGAAASKAIQAVGTEDEQKAQDFARTTKNQAESNLISQSKSIAGSLMDYNQATLVPPQVHGNTNCGDLMTADNQNCFHIYDMVIKNEYAKMIDKYFTRFRI